MGYYSGCDSLIWRDCIILAEASQRLSRTLTEELRCLKALQSSGSTPAFQDFIPVLRHAIQDLLELRFQEKNIRVEINGQPLAAPCAPVVFAFEPYTMEVILQNILSNAMRAGDFIQVRVTEPNGRIRVEVCDNGPGAETMGRWVQRNSSWKLWFSCFSLSPPWLCPFSSSGKWSVRREWTFPSTKSKRKV
jgi:hypothetical protein